MFTDSSNLGTAIIGATAFDSTTDSFSNYSIINFQGGDSLLGAGSESINIHESSGPASGRFSLTVSASSAFGNAAVPEPASVIVWSPVVTMMGGAIWLRRRLFA